MLDASQLEAERQVSQTILDEILLIPPHWKDANGVLNQIVLMEHIVLIVITVIPIPARSGPGIGL